ncbi:MAG: HAD family hydrolase [Candidatus Thorarchaeota archaeon]|nr:HAD family hydrolase [Candidatus Thorarchaeota archaeon]
MNKIRTRAIVFDFDGTLADSMPFLEMIGVQVMMKYYGVSFGDATQRYRSTTGLPYEHQIKINFPDNPDNDTAIAEFEKLKIERIFEQKLFEDAVPTLDSIAAMGVSIFVSSSTFQPTITEYFRRREMLHYFTEILGYRPGFEKGVHHFNHVKNRYNVDESELVFVGDSLKDQERAEGHAQFIALLGMFSEEDFRMNGHNGPVVKNLSDIAVLLEPVGETSQT